jgi:AcrR family transcriptional regulator
MTAIESSDRHETRFMARTEENIDPTEDLPPRPIRSRRGRGEPRRLLIEAARGLFNERGYSEATTREISDRAEVSETLMFRNFGTKAGIFRAAMVQPFVEFVQAFVAQAEAGDFSDVDDETAARLLIGGLFDLFHAHRGLVTMFWSAEVMGESELSESGVLTEVQEQFDTLIAFGKAQRQVRHSEMPAQYLTTRVTMAMVIGMAAFGESFYGNVLPKRNDIVEELVQAVLYGHQRLPAASSSKKSRVAKDIDRSAPKSSPARKSRARSS